MCLGNLFQTRLLLLLLAVLDDKVLEKILLQSIRRVEWTSLTTQISQRAPIWSGNKLLRMLFRTYRTLLAVIHATSISLWLPLASLPIQTPSQTLKDKGAQGDKESSRFPILRKETFRIDVADRTLTR